MMKAVKILENVKISDKYFRLSFTAPWSIKPGQFMEVRITDSLEPFLRRPFSLHRLRRKGKNSAIEILCEVVGKGTEILSKKKPGKPLDVIGPLGNGFDLPAASAANVLVAGGIGVAPLLALAEEIVRSSEFGVRSRKPYVLIGAKTKKQILCEKEFRQLGCDVMVSTDDGSKGYKGFVSDVLKSLLLTPNSQLPTIYACGPKPMLKETANIARNKKAPCQVLLEEYMACGVGVCLGCPVMTKGGYKMVCKDGPVFEAGDIIWE